MSTGDGIAVAAGCVLVMWAASWAIVVMIWRRDK